MPTSRERLLKVNNMLETSWIFFIKTNEPPQRDRFPLLFNNGNTTSVFGTSIQFINKQQKDAKIKCRLLLAYQPGSQATEKLGKRFLVTAPGKLKRTLHQTKHD
jgi:hypothetical protein